MSALISWFTTAQEFTLAYICQYIILVLVLTLGFLILQWKERNEDRILRSAIREACCRAEERKIRRDDPLFADLIKQILTERGHSYLIRKITQPRGESPLS